MRLTGLLGLSEFVAEAAPELAGNALVCAVNQAVYLLRRQLERQGRIFWNRAALRSVFTSNAG